MISVYWRKLYLFRFFLSIILDPISQFPFNRYQDWYLPSRGVLLNSKYMMESINKESNRIITTSNLKGRYSQFGVMPEEDIYQLLSLSPQQLFRSPDTDLIELNLVYNYLSSLPNNFSTLSTLQPPFQALDLAGNPKLGDDLPSFTSSTIVQICSLSQHLTRLSLAQCGLQSPLPSQLSTLQQLTHLSLSSNPLLQAFPTAIVQHLPRLESLDLFHTGLGVRRNGGKGEDKDNEDEPIPSTILGTLTTLRMLNLGMNSLTRIPPTICNLTNLQILRLRTNKLSTIPLEIAYLPQLNDFLCYDNPFESPLDGLRNWSGDHSSKALSLMRTCLQGSTQYNQLKLIFIGDEKAGKVAFCISI